VEAPADVLGDGVRDLAAEYNRALRYVLRRRGPELAFARLHAERLTAMLAYTRAAEALAAHAPASARHRRLAERFVARALPLVRMQGDVIRSGDLSTLESLLS
jgi:hypothetical protein